MEFLKSLLSDYRDLFNRKIYGEWITDTNEVIPVIDRLGHENVLLTYARKGVFGNNIDDEDLFDAAAAKGWVRVVHNVPMLISFTGTRKAIKRISSIIKLNAFQPDVVTVVIGILTESGVLLNDNMFNFPKDKRLLNRFLNLL